MFLESGSPTVLCSARTCWWCSSLAWRQEGDSPVHRNVFKTRHRCSLDLKTFEIRSVAETDTWKAQHHLVWATGDQLHRNASWFLCLLNNYANSSDLHKERKQEDCGGTDEGDGICLNGHNYFFFILTFLSMSVTLKDSFRCTKRLKAKYFLIILPSQRVLK